MASGHLRFPADAICDASGKPLSNRRVAVLPFIEQGSLDDRFYLDELWDSPHNLPLLAEMPEIFIDPSSPGLTTVDGKTHYLAISGVGNAITDKPEGTKLEEINDNHEFGNGLSSTAIIVQVNDAHAVEWTKPIDYDTAAYAAKPTAGIGKLHPGVFMTGFANGQVVATLLTITPEEFAAGASISSGETTEWH